MYHQASTATTSRGGHQVSAARLSFAPPIPVLYARDTCTAPRLHLLASHCPSSLLSPDRRFSRAPARPVLTTRILEPSAAEGRPEGSSGFWLGGVVRASGDQAFVSGPVVRRSVVGARGDTALGPFICSSTARVASR